VVKVVFKINFIILSNILLTSLTSTLEKIKYIYIFKGFLQPLKTTLNFYIHSYISGLTCSEITSSNLIFLCLMNAYFSF
jgi:hypothetical protein